MGKGLELLLMFGLSTGAGAMSGQPQTAPTPKPTAAATKVAYNPDVQLEGKIQDNGKVDLYLKRKNENESENVYNNRHKLANTQLAVSLAHLEDGKVEKAKNMYDNAVFAFPDEKLSQPFKEALTKITLAYIDLVDTHEERAELLEKAYENGAITKKLLGKLAMYHPKKDMREKFRKLYYDFKEEKSN